MRTFEKRTCCNLSNMRNLNNRYAGNLLIEPARHLRNGKAIHCNYAKANKKEIFRGRETGGKMKKECRKIAFCVLLIMLLGACGSTNMTYDEQYNLGVQYLEDGQYEDAILAFDAAIKIDPTARIEAYFMLHNCYMEQGMNTEAETVLRRAFEAIGDPQTAQELGEQLCQDILLEYQECVLSGTQREWAPLSQFFDYEPFSIPANEFGYALKDLNGCGLPELILMRENNFIFAIYTLVDSRPYLFDFFWARYSCFIDKNGYIVVDGSGGASDNSTVAYEISKDGKGQLKILELGVRPVDPWGDPTGVYEWYQIVGAREEIISENEANQILARFVEATQEDLSFIPLFATEADPAELARIEPAYAMLEDIGETINELKVEYPRLEGNTPALFIDAMAELLKAPENNYSHYFFSVQGPPSLAEIEDTYGNRLKCAGIYTTVGEFFLNCPETITDEDFFAQIKVNHYEYMEDFGHAIGWIMFSWQGYIGYIDCLAEYDSVSNTFQVVYGRGILKDSFPLFIIDDATHRNNFNLHDEAYDEWERTYFSDF